MGDIYLMALCKLYVNAPRKVRKLVETYTSAEEAWQCAEEPDKAKAMEAAKAEIRFIEKHHIEVYDYREDAYPQRLKECPDAPVILYGKGNLRLNGGHFLAVVGTRTCSERGRENTRRLVMDLAEKVEDLTVVSGLAYGVDVAAHKAALEVGIPTIVVPAHGLDRIYPALHRQVAVAALEHGGLLTEYMSGTEPEKLNFVARNRIIAGLSDAVVVTESKQRGGSLITARLANGYGRDVFAVPGRIDDENARGCNALIREQRAALIESADDLVQAMNWPTRPDQKEDRQTSLDFTGIGDDEHKLLTLMQNCPDGVQINTLVQESGIGYATAAGLLMGLELEGKVVSLPGGRYMAGRV